MKKYLFAYAVLATALLFFTCRHYRAENRRLVENQTALAADVTRYRTRLGAEAASVQALRLRCGEFETLRAADAEQIRRLGIRLRGHGDRRIVARLGVAGTVDLPRRAGAGRQQNVQQAPLGRGGRFRPDRFEHFLPDHVHRNLGEFPNHGFTVPADIADFGEL